MKNGKLNICLKFASYYNSLNLGKVKRCKLNNEDFNIDALRNAFDILKDCLTVYTQKKDDTALADIVADSCVKRFEYTMEAALKLMRKYLKLVYAKDDKELTVNNIFRLMAGYYMVANWENWKLYYAKRNDTSHEYNIAKARELLKIMPDFINDVDFLIRAFDGVGQRD